jgi:hypothetical protein
MRGVALGGLLKVTLSGGAVVSWENVLLANAR